MKVIISLSKGTSVLYHKTSLNNLSLIVNTNKFVLSPATANVSEQQFNRKEAYYFSLSRSKLGDATKIDHHLAVLLVIDGRKLGNRYVVRPIDYWGEDYRKLGKNEMEDRVFSDKQAIPKALSYIKEVHININKDMMDSANRRKLKTLLIQLKKRKIKVYVYDKKQSAIMLDKRKAISLKDIDLRVDKETLRQTSYYRPERTYLKPYYQLLVMPKSAKLDKTQERIVEQALMYSHDFVPSFANELHNAKNDKTTKNFRYIAKILTVMKKHKLKTPEDVRKFIVDKWELK